LGSVFLFANKQSDESDDTPSSNQSPSSDTAILLPSSCGYAQTNDTYTLKASCVLQGNLPPLTTKEITDLLRDEIETFTDIYQPFETDRTYYGSQPVFKTPNISILNGSFEANQQLIQLAKEEKEI
jgi:hypothetical protein